MADQRIGAIEVQVQQVNASACTSVSQSNTVVTLLAAASRLGVTIVNESTSTLYVKEGASASATSYTVAIVGGGTYEFPQPIYAGQVTGIWSAAGSGYARITERT